MKFKISTTVLAIFLLSGCTLGFMECYLTFTNYNKTYDFDFPKEELKNRIVESYSYNQSLLMKNLGKTIIENDSVNKMYRESGNIWLEKQNWDKFKAGIRNNTSDTLTIIIGKFHSRKHIKLLAIINGNERKSSLKVHGFEFTRLSACKKEKDYYQVKLSNRIEEKFIDKLK